MHQWTLGALDLDALGRLSQLLALYLGPGDLVLLEGDLGAGKTTFARALIRALAGNEAVEVPSPTFALVQTYELQRGTVQHFDLYRLSGPRDVREIGFAEALETGLALVEWPDRAEGLLPKDCLRIALSDETASPDLRQVRLRGEGSWAERLEHIETVTHFLAANGYGGARIAHVAGDASCRAYARLTGAGPTALLMDSPPLPMLPVIEDGKPYWQLARLAGDVRAFVSVQRMLRGYGISVPAILAQSTDDALLIVEDFGDTSFAASLACGVPMRTLYAAAADVLAELSRHPAPPGLPRYDTSALLMETRLLIDWYWPEATGAPAPAAARDEFHQLWRQALQPLEALPRNWVLRDFHSPNLFWLPGRQGLAQVGVIDFQDAVAGHAAYDLAALLQDARLDLPEDLERDLLARYLAARSAQDTAFDPEAFRRAYALMGAQRTTKILGIFVRLARRDGKRGYLAHLARIRRYLARNLADPGLSALRVWYQRNAIL